MSKPQRVYSEIEFPVFVIEDRDSEYMAYDLYSRRGDFLTLGRVPTCGKFLAGYAFDAAGKAYRYGSESGWPRFSRGWKKFLEALVLPGFLFKIIGYFVYYGPELQPGEQLDFPAFRSLVLERMQVYEKEQILTQLRMLLSRTSSYAEVINAIEWYRFYGGAS